MTDIYQKQMGLGNCWYSYESTRSMEDATQCIYRQAWERGWRPDPLRENWWQFWRPVALNKFEAKVVAENVEDPTP